METLFTAEAWSSPGGVGLFIVCVAVFLYVVTSIDAKNKKN